MHFAIIGYGKMGKAIHQLAQSHRISIIKSISLEDKRRELNNLRPDVVIEFTHADVVIPHIKLCIDLNIPIVTGTTGWHTRQTEIYTYCADHGGALFYSSNFSIGANIFFLLNKKLAEIMNQYPDYDVSIHETHHLDKKDKPSGTAISLADQISATLDRKEEWTMDKKMDNKSLFILSSRINDVHGQHTINYESEVDIISIQHTAHNRNGFALGALHAATWLIGKKGVFGMADLINLKT